MKPSSRYFAKAIQMLDGFVGTFSAPGLEPDFVRKDGEYVYFPSAEAAARSAHNALLAMLNDRAGKRYKFEKLYLMQPHELSAALDAADITPTQLAFLLHSDKVEQWLSGTKQIPHHVRLVLALVKDPRNLAIAERTVENAFKETEHV